MLPILYFKSQLKNPYNKSSFLYRIKDRCSITFKNHIFLESLKLNISTINMPPNFNKKAYKNNINYVLKMFKEDKVVLAPSTFRKLDYYMLNNFQQKLLGVSIVQGIQTILRLKNKSIKNSCIAIYDATEKISFNVICALATKARYIVLVSENLKKSCIIQEYIISNFGITPVLVKRLQDVLKNIDFLVCSDSVKIDVDVPVWYIDNLEKQSELKSNLMVNNITYKVPWNNEQGLEFTPELIGAILCQMNEKNAETALKKNNIILDKIKFNDNVLNIN